MAALPITELRFHSQDLNREVTIREYFYEVLKHLWEEGESFSGKRPLGNSGWKGDIALCLIKNKVIHGELHDPGGEDEWIEDYDGDEFDEVVQTKILKPLFGIRDRQ